MYVLSIKKNFILTFILKKKKNMIFWYIKIIIYIVSLKSIVSTNFFRYCSFLFIIDFDQLQILLEFVMYFKQIQIFSAFCN